ncbi:hypothetical protein KCP76_04595 [Salmonella enterica subsp. enterica serovar Weltevreden]|nr:hypothetical protein KCP76_04595 [Salmonella enterica subsp. enterica serovar Weltevreden]
MNVRHESGVNDGSLLLALPCHAQINAEKLKQGGAAACLLKPLTSTRLLPALTEYCQLNHHPGTAATDTSKNHHDGYGG